MRALSQTRAICLVAGALFSTGAQAQKSTANSDVRCLVIAMKLQSSSEQSVKSAAVVMAYYYFGHVDGRSPKLDLEAVMGKELDKMTPEIMSAEAKRCGNELQARDTIIAAIGQHLTQRGQAQPGGSAP